ncbi:twin-arginine translocase subunit TatC [Brachybacterium kimchii]|uniref:Sec-independent protein translocase protein TatC n=1 Tax=Brachybacterium kimchii TaxID=2942909 RepID=A0ABY4N9G7_9MICO|nr:twin-arginine translocase subunit TatC [Brachybacterium kimchii]UQN30759.1 twin-arginine translocase subunit TatC [Brachybacterium kimchii]
MAQNQTSDEAAEPAKARRGRGSSKSSAKTRRRRDPEGRMALNEHLIELRNRLVICAVAILLLSVVGWFAFDFVYSFLQRPFNAAKVLNPNLDARISYTKAGDFLSTKLQISAYIGLILSAPVVIYEIWMFLVPGLHKTERRYAIGFFGSAIPLFFIGCVAGYWIMDKAIPILLSFAPNSEAVTANLNFGDYLKLFIKTMLAFGVAFDLPVVLVLLNFLGILSGRSMLKAWRWVVFLCFAFTAVMVPTPDPFTMIGMTLPMVALYFAAVAVSFWNDRRRAKREGAELDDEQASSIDDAPEAIDGPSSLDEDDDR